MEAFPTDLEVALALTLETLSLDIFSPLPDSVDRSELLEPLF
jgi:hypothetical protein